MSLDLFRIIGGVDIQSDDLSSNTNIIQGSGIPGGDSSFQDDAPIGSIYMRSDASGTELQLYYKISTTNNNSLDWALIPSKSYVDDAIIGLSWREPAIVLDSSLTLPTQTPGSPITIDGVSITDTQRVLFSSLTTNPNVYIYDQTTGTFVEDQNSATAGDALFVTQGTSAGERWTYNGTSWVQFGASSDETEFGYIRTFIGKDGIGSETPTYTNEYVVTTTQSLETAISNIDTSLGDGDITTTTANYALTDDLAFSGTNGAGGTLSVTDALNDINDAIGDRSYTTGTNYPIVSDGESVATSLEAINVAVHNIIDDTLLVTGSITTTPAIFQTIDTIPLTHATEVKWMVQIRDSTVQTNMRASEIHVITDGTNIDSSRYAELTLGTGVVGYNLQVIISGPDIMLQAQATNNYDYAVKRVALSHF